MLTRCREADLHVPFMASGTAKPTPKYISKRNANCVHTETSIRFFSYAVFFLMGKMQTIQMLINCLIKHGMEWTIICQ